MYFFRRVAQLLYMKSLNLRGGHGASLNTIGGPIGEAAIMEVMYHIDQYITLDHMEAIDHGEAEAAMRTAVLRQVDAEDTVNQCGGWRPVYFSSSFLAVR